MWLAFARRAANAVATAASRSSAAANAVAARRMTEIGRTCKLTFASMDLMNVSR